MVIGLLTDQLIFLSIMGVLTGMLVAMIILVQRTKKATYKRHVGQAGSAEVALSFLPKQWISSPVIAATKQRDVVHRTVGPGGLILIGEGEPGRLRPLLASEVRKHERIAYGITVTTIMMGDKPGQVPLDKLADNIKKRPKVLQPTRSPTSRPGSAPSTRYGRPIPLPKGPMPQPARGRPPRAPDRPCAAGDPGAACSAREALPDLPAPLAARRRRTGQTPGRSVRTRSAPAPGGPRA